MLQRRPPIPITAAMQPTQTAECRCRHRRTCPLYIPPPNLDPNSLVTRPRGYREMKEFLSSTSWEQHTTVCKVRCGPLLDRFWPFVIPPEIVYPTVPDVPRPPCVPMFTPTTTTTTTTTDLSPTTATGSFPLAATFQQSASSTSSVLYPSPVQLSTPVPSTMAAAPLPPSVQDMTSYRYKIVNLCPELRTEMEMKENVVARIMVLSQEYFSIPSQPITMDLLRHRITLMKLPSSSSASSSTAASLRERADAIAKLDSITWDRLQVQVTDYLAAMLWQEASVGLGKIEICDECEDGAKMEEARRKWDEYDEAVKVYTYKLKIARRVHKRVQMENHKEAWVTDLMRTIRTIAWDDDDPDDPDREGGIVRPDQGQGPGPTPGPMPTPTAAPAPAPTLSWPLVPRSRSGPPPPPPPPTAMPETTMPDLVAPTAQMLPPPAQMLPTAQMISPPAPGTGPMDEPSGLDDFPPTTQAQELDDISWMFEIDWSGTGELGL